MGGAPTPKWDPIGFEPWPYESRVPAWIGEKTWVPRMGASSLRRFRGSPEESILMGETNSRIERSTLVALGTPRFRRATQISGHYVWQHKPEYTFDSMRSYISPAPPKSP